MCMKKVTKIYKPNDRIAVIYKRMRRPSRNRKTKGLSTTIRYKYLRFGNAYHADPAKRYRDRWYSNKIWADDGKFYETGFHGYPHLADALRRCVHDEVVVECIVWDIRAEGIGQRGNKNVVAKNIRMMRIIDPQTKKIIFQIKNTLGQVCY